jgi:Icc-related predicted phosphoesterase
MSRAVGSKAIYDFLLEYQPQPSLHGHIHESPEISGRWHARLGDTLCIQPGQLAPFDKLCAASRSVSGVDRADSLTYVTIDLSTMQVDRHTKPYPP